MLQVIDPPSPVSDILFLRAFEQHIVGCGEGNYDELELDLTEAQQLFAKQTLRVKVVLHLPCIYLTSVTAKENFKIHYGNVWVSK